MTIISSASGHGPALRFVAISGIGWLLDTLVYTGLVWAGLRIFWAGLLGGLCGASFSFLVSSRYAFSNRGGKLSSKLVVYLVYSVGMILAGAAAAEAVTGLLVNLAVAQQLAVPVTALAFLAKCLVTPFLLTTNFFVARLILQRV